MTIASSPKTSVLAKLTAQVMDEKRTAAKTLTPVAGEAPFVPAKVPLAFPSDLPGSFMSHEGMYGAAKDLRRHAASLIQIAEALDALSGFDSVPGGRVGPSAADLQKQKEKEGDERMKAINAERDAKSPPEAAQTTPPEVDADEAESFAERQTRLAAEAQAHTFRSTDEAVSPAVEQWTCPEHGKAVEKTSSKGRQFKGCPDCGQFER